MPQLSVEETRFMVTVKGMSAMMLSHPFFASILGPMDLIETDSDGFIPGTLEYIPAMATDSKSLVYNPNHWLREMTKEEVVAVLVHEAGHIVLAHHLRQGSREIRRWNKAADHELNLYLVKDGYKLPANVLCDKQYKGLTAEAIYDLLPPEPEKSGTRHGNGHPSADQMGGIRAPQGKNPGQGLTGEEMDKLKRELSGRMIQARQIAKRQGKMPGSFDELISEFAEPKISWQDLLQQFAARVFQSGLTWQQPNRKFAGQDIFLPGPDMDGIGALVIAIDTSGSINQEELKIFAGEVQEIVEKHKPIQTTVIYCDAAVQRVDEFKPGDSFTFTVTGRGGTRFEPVFDHIAKEGIETQAVLYFTDLYGSHINPPPDYPVLWLSTSPKTMKAPFGETIPVRPEVAA